MWVRMLRVLHQHAGVVVCNHHGSRSLASMISRKTWTMLEGHFTDHTGFMFRTEGDDDDTPGLLTFSWMMSVGRKEFSYKGAASF